MADNYVQPGAIIDLTVAGSVFSSVPVTVHSMVGIPKVDGVAGDLVPHIVEGCFLLPLKSGGVDADLLTGKPVHFNPNDGFFGGAASVVAGDINFAGIVADDNAVAADTEILVKLTPGAGQEVS